MALFGFLSACSYSQHVQRPADVSEGEGILLTRVTCPPSVHWVSIHRSGIPAEYYTAALTASTRIGCNGEHNKRTKTFALSAGDYYIGEMGRRANYYPYPQTSYLFDEDDAFHFRIRPGVIQYIGDIELRPTPASAKEGTFGLKKVRIKMPVPTAVDNYEATLERARTVNPSVFSVFPVEKQLGRKASITPAPLLFTGETMQSEKSASPTKTKASDAPVSSEEQNSPPKTPPIKRRAGTARFSDLPPGFF